MKEMSEAIAYWRDENRVNSFEGDSGLAKLEKLFVALGYSGHNYKYGSPIESFLSDNSGACEALIEWIVENECNEWREGIEAKLKNDSEYWQQFDD